jgi:kynureninase
VRYGDDGADRFAGATYDPVSHYRARAVVDFFADQAMTPARLAESYTRQTARILDAVCAAGFAPATPLDPQRRGGFVSVPVANVAEVVEGLRADGVWVDARGDLVRLGPAPYLTDAELDRGVAAFLRRARRA